MLKASIVALSSYVGTGSVLMLGSLSLGTVNYEGLFSSIKLMMQYIHVLYTNTWMQTYSGFQKPESGVRSLRFINVLGFFTLQGYSVFALAHTHFIWEVVRFFFFLSFNKGRAMQALSNTSSRVVSAASKELLFDTPPPSI